MEGYSVNIRETSKELTRKQTVMVKDVSDAIRLDEATQVEPVIIDFLLYVVLDIHNEKSDSKDYSVYVVVDQEGQKYVTGSNSFFSALTAIVEDMEDYQAENEDDDWRLKIYRKPSKNRQGKEFITCSVV